MRAFTGAALLCLAAVGCGGDGQELTLPSTTTSTAPPTTTTVPRVPTITAEAIPGLETGTVHGSLAKIGFAESSSSERPGFVTTTSKRTDATVSTYGSGPADVVKIIAEADRDVAPEVLGAVARVALTGSEARRAETWVKSELSAKDQTGGAAQPRTATATYGRQPYELLVTPATATLSVGRLNG